MAKEKRTPLLFWSVDRDVRERVHGKYEQDLEPTEHELLQLDRVLRGSRKKVYIPPDTPRKVRAGQARRPQTSKQRKKPARKIRKAGQKKRPPSQKKRQWLSKVIELYQETHSINKVVKRLKGEFFEVSKVTVRNWLLGAGIILDGKRGRPRS